MRKEKRQGWHFNDDRMEKMGLRQSKRGSSFLFISSWVVDGYKRPSYSYQIMLGVETVTMNTKTYNRNQVEIKVRDSIRKKKNTKLQNFSRKELESDQSWKLNNQVWGLLWSLASWVSLTNYQFCFKTGTCYVAQAILELLVSHESLPPWSPTIPGPVVVN